MHFGGELLSPSEALLQWCKWFLLDGPKTSLELQEAFRQSDIVPQPITVEVQEIEVLLRQGENRRCFHKCADERYCLTDDCEIELRQHQELMRQEHIEAERQFKLHVLELYPSFTASNIKDLWEKLHLFSTFLMLDYAKRIDEFESKYLCESLIQQVIPAVDPLHDYAQVVYPEFLKNNSFGKKMLLKALAQVIYVLRTTISPEAASEISRVLKGRRLYLDTNVVFALVGLTGNPDYEKSVRHVLSMAKTAGMTLFYTHRTEEEYQSSLKRFKQMFDPLGGNDSEPEYILQRRYPSVSRAFFLFRNKEKGTLEEFYARYADLAECIKQINRQFDLDISRAYIPVTLEERIISSDKNSEILEILRREPRDNYVLKNQEHDAFHIALVIDEREGYDTFTRAKSWFLTLHKLLHTVNQKLNIELPVVMTVDAWVLHFRQFLPRVEDFDQFFIDLVANDFFSHYFLSDQEVQKVDQLLRSAADRGGEEIVSRILRDTPANALKEMISDSGNTEEVLDKLLKYEARREKNSHNRDLERLKEKLTENQQLIDDMTKKNSDAELCKDTLKREKAKLVQYYRKLGEIENQQRVLNVAISKKKQEEEAVEQKQKKLGQRKICIIFITIFVLGLIGFSFWSFMEMESGVVRNRVLGITAFFGLSVFGLFKLLIYVLERWVFLPKETDLTKQKVVLQKDVQKHRDDLLILNEERRTIQKEIDKLIT